jgi:hypothetical protein
MSDWITLPDEKTLDRTVAALRANGIEAVVVENGDAARKKALEIIPEGAEIMNNPSVTLDTIGLAKELVESGRFNSVRKQLMAMDRKTQNREMQRIGAAPEWTTGSVHAITEDGHVLIASNTGSQLPGYASAAEHVLWIAGAQKIVKDVPAGMQRIYEHVLPLENVRAQKAYGMGSAVNKLLIVNADKKEGRITLIIIKEAIGF